MSEENQNNESMADEAVDKAQERAGDQSKASQAAEKAQDKGLVQKAEEKVKQMFGKGNG